MSKTVNYLPRKNPIKLKPPSKLTPGRQEIIGKASRKGKNSSTKVKGTIDLRLKNSYTITSI